jgi:hypothetical protein
MVKDFKTYYNSKFREDLNMFFSTIPDESKFHEDKQNKLMFSVQYERLTPAFDHLDFLDKEEMENFGVALFFMVLTDMVCFTYFKRHYKKFRRLTRYPKFIGNCPCACNVHYHPIEIFLALNKACSNKKNHLDFFDRLSEAIDTMRKETISLFNEHLPEIEVEMFWSKCKKEFPCKTDRILYQSFDR